MSIVTRTKTYAVCPHCQADAGCIDHLLGSGCRTRWYCDTCGGEFNLILHSQGATADISTSAGRRIATMDVLILRPQDKPIYFVVKGMRFEPRDSPVTEDTGKKFFYESHSCPTNWLQPVLMYHDGSDDPHGLIEYVATVDLAALPPNETVSPNAHEAALVEIIERHAITEHVAKAPQ